MSRLRTHMFQTSRSRAAAGIDIADTVVRAVALSGSPGRRTIQYHAAFPRTDTHDARVLTDILRMIRSKGRIRSARFAVPAEQAFTFLLDVPTSASPAHIREIAAFNFERNAPLSVDEAAIAYTVLRRGEHCSQVSVSAVRRTALTRIVEAARTARIAVQSIELAPAAAARALITPGTPGVRAHISIGEHETSIAIIMRGYIAVLVSSPFGIDAFVSALMREHEFDAAAAREYLHTCGLADDPSHPQAADTLRDIAQQVADECTRVLARWHEQRDFDGMPYPDIGSITLLGPLASAPCLSEYIATHVGVPADPADVWQDAGLAAGYVPEIPAAAAPRYATAIGLALGSPEHDASFSIDPRGRRATLSTPS